MTWTRETLRNELMVMFVEHAEPGTPVHENSHLIADLGIDSLGVMEVVADIEDKFCLTIPDESLREVNTVEDVARAIETKLQMDGRLTE